MVQSTKIFYAVLFKIARELFMKKNFLLDIILLICGITCIITGIVMDFHLVPGGWETRYIIRQVHIYSGYIMAIGIILHVAWHGSWIKSAAKNFFHKK